MCKITAVDVGMCLPKCFVIFVNLFTFLLGSLIVGISVYCLIYVGSTSNSSILTAILYGLIAFGVFIVIISFFGCCGACLKNRCMLMTFAVLLLIIFVMQAVVVYLVYSESSLVNEATDKVLLDSFKRAKDDFVYSESSLVNKSTDKVLLDWIKTAKDDELFFKLWEVVQFSFKCCGVNSSYDWKTISDHLPMSCCLSQGDNVTTVHSLDNSTCTEDHAHVRGCKKFVTDYIQQFTNPTLTAVIVVLVIQLANIIFSCCMFCVYGRKSREKINQEEAECKLPRLRNRPIR